MAIEFEFVLDYKEYRKYVTYLTAVDHVIGKLPLEWYQGDMDDCFVIERKGNIVEVTLTSKAESLVKRFSENAQPNTFESIPEGVAYIYNLDRHELIYNFDTKEPSSRWNWSTYPETFWMGEDTKYPNGLCLGSDGSICRVYLNNEPLMSLLVSIAEINHTFPQVSWEDVKANGLGLALNIISSQLGQPEVRASDVVKVISCDLLEGKGTKLEYDVSSLVDLFIKDKYEMYDEWEDVWGSGVGRAIELDNLADDRMASGTTTNYQESYTGQLLISELIQLPEVPQVDRVTYVHCDIRVNGISYMMIIPDQTLQIYYDDLIIKPDDIREVLDNIPEEQIEWYAEYGTDLDKRALDDGIDYDSFQREFDALKTIDGNFVDDDETNLDTGE
jgi:hypothetical protein